MTNFSIGKDIDLTYDPTVCQSPQECAAQTIQKDIAQRMHTPKECNPQKGVPPPHPSILIDAH